MHHAEKDSPIVVPFSWLWTPLAVLATVTLVLLTVLATPFVLAVSHLSLPRTVKPLRDA